MVLTKIEIAKNTLVEWSSSELLFLAQSGQPYRGELHIHFKSLGESVNLLDLKKYITSLRSKKFYAEDIAFEIFQTINETIKSENLGVVVNLTARGGIRQKLTFGHQF